MVVEDVDEDPQGANATFKDDLVLLSGPAWGRELTKLLRAEQKERYEIQGQRVARVRRC